MEGAEGSKEKEREASFFFSDKEMKKKKKNSETTPTKAQKLTGIRGDVHSLKTSISIVFPVPTPPYMYSPRGEELAGAEEEEPPSDPNSEDSQPPPPPPPFPPPIASTMVSPVLGAALASNSLNSLCSSSMTFSWRGSFR